MPHYPVSKESAWADVAEALREMERAIPREPGLTITIRPCLLGFYLTAQQGTIVESALVGTFNAVLWTLLNQRHDYRLVLR